MSLTAWKGILISHECITRQHDKCTDTANGCQCACGCNNGAAGSNLSNNRRSSICTAGKHLGCYKGNGTPCPCECHSILANNRIYSYTQQRSLNVSFACYYNYHANCNAYNVCECETCNHSLAPIFSNTTGSTTSPAALNYPIQSQPAIVPTVNLMPVNSKANYSQAAVKLQSIMTEIIDKMFLGDKDKDYIFYGDTVRDALFGGLVEEYKVATYLDKFVEYYLQSKYPADIHGKRTLYSQYGDLIVSVVGDYQHDISPWICDNYKYSISGGIIKPYNYQMLENNNTLGLSDSVDIDDPKEVLAEGIKLAQKYNWTLHKESIEHLAKLIEKNKPLENTHELVVGFRSYNINSFNNLTGHGHSNTNDGWPSEKMSVDCPDFKQHVLEVDADWRGRAGSYSGSGGQHDCGIYVYKEPQECLYHYGKTDQAIALVTCWGVIGEFDEGYRVEHCKIERLWIWDKDTRLNDKYNIESIVSGAKFGDFIYDPQVMQYSNRE